jgi:hypothetical protein
MLAGLEAGNKTKQGKSSAMVDSPEPAIGTASLGMLDHSVGTAPMPAPAYRYGRSPVTIASVVG